tara:strand:- start:459 stop:989 length:531 start_codon:yes stop_codon:yes gene_type:complete
MKYLVKFIVVTLSLLICTYSFAETSQKIVVLDLTYVLNDSKAGKNAQDFLKKTFDNDKKKFSSREKKLKEEEKDLLNKKNILSKEEYGEKMNELRKKNMVYQTERRTAIDKITTKRAEARRALLKKLTPILESYVEENNISLVVDKKYIIGGGTKSDITRLIVEKLNKELPSLNLK